jgi:hypothetical protein
MDRRRIFIVPTRRDLDLAEAVGHWTGRHGEVFGATPEVGAYVQHQPSWEDQVRLGGIVCSEISFPDKETERRAFTCDYYVAEVIPDEASFLQRDEPWMALITASERVDGPGGDIEVLVFGWDGNGLPEGVAAEICELDRPGPRSGPGRLLVLTAHDDVQAGRLRDAMTGDVVFAASRVAFV